MECVRVEKCVEQAGATDIADDNDLIAVKAHILKCLIKCVRNALMGTARA